MQRNPRWEVEVSTACRSPSPRGSCSGSSGPNGAGKTTAMRIILGVLEPDAGEVRWRGQPMTYEMRKRVGYLPEDHGQTFSPTVRSPAGCLRMPSTRAPTLRQATWAATPKVTAPER